MFLQKQVECATYSTTVDLHNFPAFTDTFKTRILELNKITKELSPYRLDVKKTGPTTLFSSGIVTYMNTTTEKKFDSTFSKFIEEFGTHFIESGTFGGKMLYRSNLRNFDMSNSNNQDEKSCFDRQGDT